MCCVEDLDEIGPDDPGTVESSRSWTLRRRGYGGRRNSGRGRMRRGDERGATLVEYALLVALFAIPTITAVNALQDASRVTIEDTASRISTRSAPGDLGN